MSPLPAPLGRSLSLVVVALVATGAGGCSFDTESPTATTTTSSAPSTSATSSSTTSSSTTSTTSGAPTSSTTSPPPTSTSMSSGSASTTTTTSASRSTTTQAPPPTKSVPVDDFTSWAQSTYPGAAWLPHVTSVGNNMGVLAIKTDLAAGATAEAKPILEAGKAYAASGNAGGFDGSVVVLSKTGSTLGFHGMD